MSVSVLDRELYTIPYAARVLKVAPSTLRWWLEGRDHLAPVLRERPSGSANVTWGELVEARWLQLYRGKDVRLSRIRDFVTRMRMEVGVPYPLAHYGPFVGPGPALVLEGQRAAGLSEEEGLFIETASGQLLLSGWTTDYLDQVAFAEADDGWAKRIRPEGPRSPIVIDPDVAFGAATVRGIRTENIAELDEAGEDRREIAEQFGLGLGDVHAAISYELRAAA